MTSIRGFYKLKYVYSHILLSYVFFACDLEQNINIDLPQTPSQLFVECYLQEGKPMRLALTESESFLAEVRPESILGITDATVSITHNNIEHNLIYGTNIDTLDGTLSNYISEDTLKSITSNTEYELSIRDENGRVLKGNTRFLEKPAIENIEARFRESDSLALVLITFSDLNPSEDNFYILKMNRDSLTGNKEFDFYLDDTFTTNNKITVGTGHSYEKGDTLIVSLYHIEEKYYNFLQSVDDAANANGNPFAQPAIIKHTVEEGMGVFTTLSYDRRMFIIKEE